MPKGDPMVRRMHIVIAACALLVLQLLDSQGAAAEKCGAKVYSAASPAATTYKEGELIVRFRDGVSQRDKERVHARNGSKTLKHYNRLGVHRVKIPDGVAM